MRTQCTNTHTSKCGAKHEQKPAAHKSGANKNSTHAIQRLSEAHSAKRSAGLWHTTTTKNKSSHYISCNTVAQSCRTCRTAGVHQTTCADAFATNKSGLHCPWHRKPDNVPPLQVPHVMFHSMCWTAPLPCTLLLSWLPMDFETALIATHDHRR